MCSVWSTRYWAKFRNPVVINHEVYICMTYWTTLSQASVNCHMIIYSRYSKFRFRWWSGAHLAEKSSVFLILIWRQNCGGLNEVWDQSVQCFKLNKKCTWPVCTQHVSQFSSAVHNYQTMIKAWAALVKMTEAGSYSQTQLRDCFFTLSSQDRNRSSSWNVLFFEYKTMHKVQKPSNPKCSILLSELFRIDLCDEYRSGRYPCHRQTNGWLSSDQE